MRTILQGLQWTHIASGSIVLLVGFIIILLKKGDKRHALLGRIYYYTVLLTTLSSLPQAYLLNNFFLFTLGIFTLYFAITGKRYSQKIETTRASTLDWLVTSFLIIFGMGFFVYSIYHLIQGTQFGYIFLFFGFLSIFLAYQDFKCFNGLSNIKNYGLVLHLQRMVGSYITSWTAFIVVNVTFLPLAWTWFLPILIMIPISLYWTSKLKILHKV